MSKKDLIVMNMACVVTQSLLKTKKIIWKGRQRIGVCPTGKITKAFQG
jgi:hypothetical protein